MPQLWTFRYEVPQGLILEPLLFLSYIRGLLGVLWGNSGSVCLYAENTNVQWYLEMIRISWNFVIYKFNINSLKIKTLVLLNLNKTTFISFSIKKLQAKIGPIISIDNNTIKQESCSTILGLTTDANWNWDNHTERIITKILSVIYALRRVSKIFNWKTMNIFAPIDSHICYGVRVMEPLLKRIWKLLEQKINNDRTENQRFSQK